MSTYEFYRFGFDGFSKPCPSVLYFGLCLPIIENETMQKDVNVLQLDILDQENVSDKIIIPAYPSKKGVLNIECRYPHPSAGFHIVAEERDQEGIGSGRIMDAALNPMRLYLSDGTSSVIWCSEPCACSNDISNMSEASAVYLLVPSECNVTFDECFFAARKIAEGI